MVWSPGSPNTCVTPSRTSCGPGPGPRSSVVAVMGCIRYPICPAVPLAGCGDRWAGGSPAGHRWCEGCLSAGRRLTARRVTAERFTASSTVSVVDVVERAGGSDRPRRGVDAAATVDHRSRTRRTRACRARVASSYRTEARAADLGPGPEHSGRWRRACASGPLPPTASGTRASWSRSSSATGACRSRAGQRAREHEARGARSASSDVSRHTSPARPRPHRRVGRRWAEPALAVEARCPASRAGMRARADLAAWFGLAHPVAPCLSSPSTTRRAEVDGDAPTRSHDGSVAGSGANPSLSGSGTTTSIAVVRCSTRREHASGRDPAGDGVLRLAGV